VSYNQNKNKFNIVAKKKKAINNGVANAVAQNKTGFTFLKTLACFFIMLG
jgi:hypothetical protein